MCIRDSAGGVIDIGALVAELGHIAQHQEAVGKALGDIEHLLVLLGIPVAIGSGDEAQTLQDILDAIMPGMLGMIAFWLYYWLLSKKINPMVLIVATMAVGIVGAFFGVLA